MNRWVEYRGSKTAELHTQGQRYKSSVNLLFFKFSWSYLPQPAAYILHVDMPLTSTCHPQKFSWSHLEPVAYAMHVTMLPSSMPPAQFSTKNTCILFTLGTRCISCYFYSTTVQFLSLHWQMLKGSSSQYPTLVSFILILYLFTFLYTLVKLVQKCITFCEKIKNLFSVFFTLEQKNYRS